MIRTFENSYMIEQIWEDRHSPTGYVVRCRKKNSPLWGTWRTGYYESFAESLAEHLLHWKEISTLSIDPNDVQPCPHVYDAYTDTCKLCNKGWNEILWDINGAGGTKPCCGGVNTSGPHYYQSGKWHDADCDTLKPPTQAQISAVQPPTVDYRPIGSKKGLCTCGSASVGSDRHSSYCDVKS